MIKLKTLLMEWHDTDPAHVKYWIMKHVPAIAAKLGEQIDRKLGGGMNGVAFLLKSGKVLKITGDKQEVAAASRYRTKQRVPHLVSVYDVRELEGDIVDPTSPDYATFKTSWDRSRQHYVIIMDAVTPFNNHEQRVWQDLGQDYLNPRFDDEITREELESFIDGNTFGHMLPETWINTMIAQRQSVLAAFRRNQVFTQEAHAENMGWNRHGQLVHFDWWMVDQTQTSGQWTRFQDKPRRLNKPVRYDASGIDTPNDPTM